MEKPVRTRLHWRKPRTRGGTPKTRLMKSLQKRTNPGQTVTVPTTEILSGNSQTQTPQPRPYSTTKEFRTRGGLMPHSDNGGMHGHTSGPSSQVIKGNYIQF